MIKTSASTGKTIVYVAPLEPTDEPGASILEITALLAPSDKPGASTLETRAQLACIIAKRLLVLANKHSSRETLVFDATMQSVSDMSSDIESLMQVNKKRKWAYLEWITEAPISISCDSNGGLYPLCKFPVTIGGKAN